jgi:hypothetical protein
MMPARSTQDYGKHLALTALAIGGAMPLLDLAGDQSTGKARLDPEVVRDREPLRGGQVLPFDS